MDVTSSEEYRPTLAVESESLLKGLAITPLRSMQPWNWTPRLLIPSEIAPVLGDHACRKSQRLRRHDHPRIWTVFECLRTSLARPEIFLASMLHHQLAFPPNLPI